MKKNNDNDNAFFSNCLAFLLGAILCCYGHPFLGIFVAILLWNYDNQETVEFIMNEFKLITEEACQYINVNAMPA